MIELAVAVELLYGEADIGAEVIGKLFMPLDSVVSDKAVPSGAVPDGPAIDTEDKVSLQ
jgi:hypothetical protein